ncbi:MULTISPECIES: GntP family permease [Kocuria]|uniref:Gluconate:H+ symporter, GntP family n=1 Tax=Kocuria marina subsp. indica TaxID=1049583 RepID=A0A1X7DXX8_9MICC|nr:MULTISPECIES: GntP family permease [Kocuria]MBN6812623.1 GntP family permease [Kocuria indica]MBN6844359.1 GntP family permease [Kocuria indica]MCG7431830.1 GntP family permease [Kocuria indica]OXS81129.1 permease [Kocuria indica]QIR70380.1 GntP family permease [Kocuria sp. KD4]
MEIEGWSQTLTAGPLLLIAAAAIAVLLVLIITFRVHAFLALIIISALTAFATGIPTSQVVPVLLYGFGNTLASVALLVGLGAMLGRLLETSGGAQVLADRLIRAFGEKRAPLALGVASLLFGFPIFFDAGLVVMLPVVFSVARRLGGSVLTYALPAVGAFSVMHVFLPPHPGPVTAATFFEANVGYIILVGLICAIPTWYVSSYLFGKFSGRRIKLPVPAILGQAEDVRNPPAVGTVVAMLLLPMLLIFLNTGLGTLAKSGAVSEETSSQAWFELLRAIGETPIALTLTLIIAALTIGKARGVSGSAIEKTFESALGPVCSVILITGAGGMFGGVLRTSGIGNALEDVLADLGIPLIIAGFLIAAVMRVAQGSATVALTTAAGLIAPAVLAADYNVVQLAAMVVAVAAGSVVLSHVNDSGFWLVGRFLEMDVRTTFKTWTVLETIIGVLGFAIAAAIFGLAGAV